MRKTLNKKALRVLLLSVAILSLAACNSAPNVEYGDPSEVETVTSGWGSTDLQGTAEKMAQSMLDSHWITRAEARPKIRMSGIRNLTDEHIDTKAITDKVRIRIIQSGRVRILENTAAMDEIFAERDFTEALTLRGENKLLADTDYIVTGTIRTIRKQTKKAADVYYLITLELVDPQSAEIVWADEKEIRKTSSNPKVGW